MKNFFLIFFAVLVFANFAFSDDFDGAENSLADFLSEENFSGGDGDESGKFFSEDFSGAENSSEISIFGEVEMPGRFYVEKQNDGLVKANPAAKFSVGYSGATTEIFAKLKFDSNSLGDFKFDILDEASILAYLGRWQIEAGKIRLVWGKGDKLHVLDNFNANDYTDYIIPDYIDRRIAEPMFRVSFSTEKNFKLEAVYAPILTAERFSKNGIWQPAKIVALKKNAVEQVSQKLGMLAAEKDMKFGEVFAAKTKIQNMKNEFQNPNSAGSQITLEQIMQAEAALKQAQTSYESALENYLLYLNAANALNSNPDSIYPDTANLRYGQAGLRATFTLGAIDLGASYYYGRLKQPSIDYKKFLQANGEIEKIKDALFYERIHIFGVEGAFVIPGLGLNTRFEFAYNMTEDFSGNDAAIHNNSIAWVFGFDRDLPLHNINFNIQTQGKYIFKKDEIKKNAALDVDWDPDVNGKNRLSNNKLVFDISDSWNYEKILLDLKAIWGIERGDVSLLPTLTFKIAESFAIDLSGLFIWAKNDQSEFAGWEHNSFAQISCRCKF